MKKATLSILSFVGGIGIGTLVSKKKRGKTKASPKFKMYYHLLNSWMAMKNQGKNLETYFLEKGYTCIAIYGMGELGERLYEELKGSKIQVKYGIDKNPVSNISSFDVYELHSELEKVDVIVVTPIADVEKISEQIEKVCEIKSISLEDAVYGL